MVTVKLYRFGQFEKTVDVVRLSPTLVQMVCLSDGTLLQEEYLVVDQGNSWRPAEAKFNKSFVASGQIADLRKEVSILQDEKNALETKDRLRADRLKQLANESWGHWKEAQKLKAQLADRPSIEASQDRVRTLQNRMAKIEYYLNHAQACVQRDK